MTLTKIYAVDEVDLIWVDLASGSLVVRASGRAATTGWRNSVLSAYVYIKPPVDGVQEFDFLAVPPAQGTISLPVLTPMHADTAIEDVNLADYWAPGVPLAGIRVHALSNSKLAGINEQPHMPAPRRMSAADLASYTAAMPEAPGFEADIKLKFRSKDVLCMKAVSGFDLHDYEDVKRKAEDIFTELDGKTMPKDGPWPETDIALFRAWIDAGMQP